MKSIFSIIIPHYNTPELLVRCLKTIPVREDIQVIVVDDCSPNSDDYLQRYPELSRPYLEYYSTSKGGSAGRARNVGLDHARGKWLLFADSDDLFVDTLGEILNSKKDAEEDIIFFRKKTVLSTDLNKVSERSNWADEMIDEYLKTGNEVELRRRFYAPWCKIIRRSIVEENHIRFNETRYSNDAFFSTFVGIMAKKISIMDYPIYILTEREGSLASDYLNKPGEFDERADVCYSVQKLLQEHHFPVDLQILSDFTLKYYNRDRSKYKDYLNRIRKLDIRVKDYMKEIYYNYKRGDGYRRLLWMGYHLYVKI